MKFDLTVKNIIIVLLALVVIFIPTYIAIACYESGNTAAGVETTETTYLQVKDPAQNEYKIEQSSDADSQWCLFSNMINNAVSTSSIPESVKDDSNMLLATYYTVKTETDSEGQITENTDKKSYAFYFSTDKSNCYFMDPDQKIFKVSEADAKTFLSNALSNFLYKSAVTPVFTAFGSEVNGELEWNYLAAGGVYQAMNLNAGEEKTFTYKVKENIPLSFSIEPSQCTVKITDDSGTSLFDSTYTSLSSLELKRNTTLHFTVSAHWYKTENCDAYGEANYSFTVSLIAPAEFKLNTNEIYRGEFAVISAINIVDPSKISFSTSEDAPLPYIPQWYKTGDTYSALIPVSYGCSGTSYMFTLSYDGGDEQKLALTVKYDKDTQGYRYGYKDSSIDVSANVLNTCYTDSQVETYNNLVKTICSQTSTEAKFSGTFLDYSQAGVLTEKGATLKLGFARVVKIYNGKTNTNKSYIHTGLDYAVTSKTAIDVPALNAGTVCATGTDSVMGNYVVIDHGCGLRSWYEHLTEISVKVGDTVATKQAVGKTASTGCTGFTVDGRVHVGLTVYDQPVAIYGIWDKGGIQLAEFD